MSQVTTTASNLQQRAALGLLSLLTLAAATVVAFDPGLLRFAPIGVAELTRMLMPLVVVSLFLERAVEVFVTPWRQGERDELEMACREEGVGDEDRALRRQTLASYRDETRCIAFLASVSLGVAVAALGMRGLEQLLDADMLAALRDWQRLGFSALDVAITGALLAGGADGLHKVISAFTTFVEQSTQRMR